MPRLLLRAGLTSGAIMSIADCLAQALETKGFQTARPGESSSDYDWGRTARFAVVGFTLHGPYFQRGFSKVDAVFGPSLNAAGNPVWSVLGKKVVATQIVLNAPFMVLLFGWMGALEGRSWPDGIIDNIQTKWPMAFWAGNMFWPVANLINFRFLGPQHRVAYVATCGAVWNTFISWMNKEKDLQKQSKNQASLREQ